MPNYRVTDTKEIERLTPGGGTATVIRVWLQTDRGARGSVEVSPDQWNAETLKPILDQKASELDLAFTLSEG